MNTAWLLEHADAPIRYNLTKDGALIEALLANEEVAQWLSRLAVRARTNDLSNLHGGHDYRYENIIGKCFLLGLDANVPAFDEVVRFFLRFLEEHIQREYDDAQTFWRMYQYRDYETILACYLPFLGYADEPCVQHVARKRIELVYEFTSQKRYDIYRSENAYPGANKAWKPYIVDPALYRDGNIRLPSIHDLILYAGVYASLDEGMRNKVETTVAWLFGKGYEGIRDSLYYYAPDDPSYKSKGINSKVALPDVFGIEQDKHAQQKLLFTYFILSHFAAARASGWYARTRAYLEQYRTDAGRYRFARAMLVEKPDQYVTSGGHMNVGESKRNALYAEILSTYWMARAARAARA